MRFKYIRIAGLAIGGLILGGVLLVHTPQAKRFAFRQLQNVLAAQGIKLEASGVDYNLLTMEAKLRGVEVTPEASLPPLAKLEGLDVRLSLRDLIRGHFVVANAALQRPEIWIVIDANGLSNLPKTDEPAAPDAEPFEYLVQALAASNGSFRFDDRRDGLQVALPEWNLTVKGDRGAQRHDVTFSAAAPGSVLYGGTRYELEEVRARIDAGIRDARMTELALRTPGASVSGSIGVGDFRRLPLDGSIHAEAEPGRFLPKASGQVAADLTLGGTVDKPVVNGELRAADAGWEAYRNIQASTRFSFDSGENAVTVSSTTVRSPYGDANGEGRIALGPEGASSFRATVSGVRLDRFAPEAASTARGTVRAEWRGLEAAKATGEAAMTLTANRAPAKGVYPVAGRIRASRSAAGTVAHLDELTLGGAQALGTVRLSPADALSGQITATMADVAAQPYAEVPFTGAVTLTADLDGTASHPAAVFALEAPALAAGAYKGIAASAAGRADAEMFVLDRAAVTWGGQSLTARGSAGLTGGAAPVSLTAEAVNADLGALLAVSGNGSIPAEGTVTLRVNAGGTVDQPSGTATLAVTGLKAYGETLGQLRATAEFDKQRAAIPELVLDKAPGETLRGSGEYSFRAETFRGEVESTPLTLTKGTVALALKGSGTAKAPSVEAAIEGNLTDLGPVSVKAAVERELFTVQAEAPRQNITARMNGRTEAPYPFSAEIDAKEMALESVAAWKPEELDGTIAAQVRATGELENWRDAEATLRGEKIALTVNGHPVRTEGTLEAAVRRGELALKPVTIQGLGARLTASGSAPGALQLNGAVNLEAALKALRPEAPGKEKADGELALSGTVETAKQGDKYHLDPHLSLRLTGGSYSSEATGALTGVTLAAEAAEGTMRLNTLAANWAGGTISGSGEFPLGLLSAELPFTMPRKAGDAALEVSARGLQFARMPGVPEAISGGTSFTVSLSAPRPDLAAAAGTVRFDELQMRAGTFSLAQEAPSVVRLAGGSAAVEQFTLTGPEAKAVLSGTAELTGAQALRLRLASNLDLALASAFTDAVKMRGATEFALRVGGTLTNPEPAGYVVVTNADAAVSSPRVQAEKLNVRLDLASNRVNVSRFTGTLNGGTLNGSGGVSFRGGTLENLDLRVASKGVYMDFPANLKTSSNAEIFLRSNRDRFLLGGKVDVVDGSYTEPVNLDQGLLNVLSSEATPERPEERSPLLERLDYGLAIRTEHPLVIDNNLAKAEVQVNARLTGSYYEPGLVGRVTVEEGGTLNLNEREYLVDRGVLTFTDERKIEPIFDIVARTQAAGYDVTLSVQGSGKDQTTLLTSDPSLPEPDIASILLTGRTLDELQGQEVDVAKEQVLSYLTGRVGGGLGRGLERATGLSTVRIEPNLIANESDPSARLTIGQDLTRKLSLIYSMNLTDSGDQILVGQYDIAKRFRTRALKQTDNSYRFDFSRRQEFGGRPADPVSTAEREKKKIGIVEFSGEQIFSEEQLRKWLNARQEKTYDFFQIRKGLERITGKHANEGYLEARVNLDRRERDGHIDLDLEVQPGPKVDFVYEGYRPNGGVQKRIRKQWMDGVFDAQRTDDAARTLRQDMARHGYLSAQIETSIEMPETSRKRVVFDIQPGEKYDAPKLVFAGAKGIEESELRDLLREHKMELAALGRPEPSMELLTDHYRQQGYLDAKVARPELILDAAAKKSSIVYPVDEGPHYRVGRIRFTGNQVYPETELLEAAGLEAGGEYKTELREETIANVRQMYASKGYNAAEVKYYLNRMPADGRTDVVFQIAEGPQSIVREVTISGNDHTSKGLIRSQLELKPGDPVDPAELSKSRRNLYSTGAYSLVDIQRNVTSGADGKNDVSLSLNVREVRPFQMNYGGYFDTDRGPGGIVDFSNRNSLGSARILGVRARYDADLREARGYFTQPLLKRFPLRTTSSAFTRREIREGFNTDRIGVSVIQEARFRDNWILNYGYRLERTHTYDQGPDPIFDVVLRVAPFTTSLTRDTRDDFLDATRGSLISSAVEYAPKFSGSELNFIKYFGQYFRYFAFDKAKPVPFQQGLRKNRLVFATGARVGLAAGLEGQELIPGKSPTNRVNLGERFFAGGGTTIRGFRQDGVGERMFDGVSPAGGDALFILNNELRFPLKGIFDGVGFLDVGNVYDRLEDFNPWSVRKAAGVGIRVRTPYFLIRFDYGFKLDRRPGEPIGRPFISIGQAF